MFAYKSQGRIGNSVLQRQFGKGAFTITNEAKRKLRYCPLAMTENRMALFLARLFVIWGWTVVKGGTSDAKVQLKIVISENSADDAQHQVYRRPREPSKSYGEVTEEVRVSHRRGEMCYISWQIHASNEWLAIETQYHLQHSFF